MAVESCLGVMCFVRSPRENTCFARDEPSSKRVGRVDGVGLSRTPPKLRSWRCTRPRAAEATVGVAVVGEMTSIPCAAAIVRYTLWRGERGMRHADLQRGAPVMAAKPASALLYDTAVSSLVSLVCGRVSVCFVVERAMRRVQKHLFD